MRIFRKLSYRLRSCDFVLSSNFPLHRSFFGAKKTCFQFRMSNAVTEFSPRFPFINFPDMPNINFSKLRYLIYGIVSILIKVRLDVYRRHCVKNIRMRPHDRAINLTISVQPSCGEKRPPFPPQQTTRTPLTELIKMLIDRCTGCL